MLVGVGEPCQPPSAPEGSVPSFSKTRTVQTFHILLFIHSTNIH